MAAVEWIDMADRIKVFPLAVLATMVLFGLLVWWAIARSKAAEPKLPGPDEPVVSFQGGGSPSPVPKLKPAASPSVDTPPPAKDPGEKILEGADRAFDTEYFETALMFYKDFELRYAGSETYDRNAIRIFERIYTSAAKMKKRDDTLPAYLDSRRKAADEWKRLKPLLAVASTDQSRAELRKYADSLPLKDGRRIKVEAWLSPGGGEK